MALPYRRARRGATIAGDPAGIIASRTGKPLADVRTWENTELAMDAAVAQGHGLIHGVRNLTIPADAFFHQIVI